MLKNNFLNKKSKGQHILELALMMPFFIIAFGYAFQIMAETYAKYKFSYVFANTIRLTVDKQPVLQNINKLVFYDIREEIENSIKDIYRIKDTSVFTDIQAGTISTPNTLYIIGAFQYKTKMLFLNDRGKEYFYFIVPINSAFSKPPVLPYDTTDINGFFDRYYSLSGAKYLPSQRRNVRYSIDGALR